MPRFILEIIAFGGIVAIIISLISTTKDGNTSNIIPIISLYVMAGYRLMPAFQHIYSGASGLKFDLPAFENLILEVNIFGSKIISILLNDTRKY